MSYYWPMRKPILWIVATSGLIGLIAALYQFAPDDRSFAHCRLENNAVWASLDWTSQPVDSVAVKQLAQETSSRKIRYFYPFTTYVKQDGFSKAYVHAAEFVREFKKHNTETKLVAWVGVPLKREGLFGIDGWVDLSDAEQRKTITVFVTQLMDEANFDGVHINVETVLDGNAGYLLFLEEVANALGPNIMISIAGESWKPSGIPPSPADHRWGPEYYREVAQRVDQISAMTYDSQMIDPESYHLWMSEQVVGIGNSIAGLDTELLIGLSISREETFTHHPAIESVDNALIGICNGIQALGDDAHPISGAAMYASWEATDADWEIWDRWLATSKPSQ